MLLVMNDKGNPDDTREHHRSVKLAKSESATLANPLSSEKVKDQAFLSGIELPATNFHDVLEAAPRAPTSQHQVSMDGWSNCSSAISSPGPTPTESTDTFVAFAGNQSESESAVSWRGELVFPCIEEKNDVYYNTDIFGFTNQTFRGREFRFPNTTYPVNEQGWENLRIDLIESARRSGYNLTSRGRDIDRNRIRLVCQQYRLYRSGTVKSSHTEQGELEKGNLDVADEDQVNEEEEADDAKPPAPTAPTRKRLRRPKTHDTKCHVQLSIFYKDWGDPKGYFYLKGGTGEAVHCHHARFEDVRAPSTNIDFSRASPSNALPLTYLAKLIPSGNVASEVNVDVVDELKSHFDMFSSTVLQFPHMLDFAKRSLIELNSTIRERGLMSPLSIEESDQEVLSSSAALSSLRGEGRNLRNG